MDPRTAAVRKLYEKYPYPSGSPKLRVGFDARFVLAQGRLARPEPRPLEILDAGCGRGIGLLAAAELQPDVRFLGVDLCQRALEHAHSEARGRNLENVRFAEVDLETLDDLEVPPGGFDIIHSSGVVHHLVDPQSGLERLGKVLAPHGVIVFMVYGALGRTAYEQVRHSIDVVVPRDVPLESRLEQGRALVQSLAKNTNAQRYHPWIEAAQLDDVEFVDRYLHVQEKTFTVPTFFDLVEGAGLSFLQWCQPERWLAPDHLQPGPQRERIRNLDERARASFVEQLLLPRALEAYLVHPENGPRPRLEAKDATRTTFLVNPEAAFEVVTRPHTSGLSIEAIRVKLDGYTKSLPPGPLGTAALLLRDETTSFTGQELVDALTQKDVSEKEAGGVLFELVHRRLVYRPHPIDVPRSP